MKSVLAASAVLALAGSSYGFTLITTGMNIGDFLEPTSGQLRFAEVYNSSPVGYDSQFTGAQGLVTGIVTDWTGSRALINNSSWFAVDPKGPNGNYSLGNNQLTNGRPGWNAGYASNAAWTGLGVGAPVWVGSGDGDNLIDRIDGGISWSFAPQRGAAHPDGPGLGAISTLNSGSGDAFIDSVQSVFLGRFTLTDPQAVLRGALLITLAGIGPAQGQSYNLDGTPLDGHGLYQQRDGNSINVFMIEIPAPGALAAFGLAGLAGIRRRR